MAMMNESGGSGQADDRAGLCARCRHVRVVVSAKGSRFYMCERSRDDERFPRYPPIPVLRCGVYEPGLGEIGNRE